MLTQGEDVEVHALAGRGWSISAIARHLGRDRATVRGYLAGERTPGIRKRAAPDPLEPFVAYLAARFADDPHLWLTALFDEVVRLGYPRSYPSFARGVRRLELRPHCEPCRGVKGRATIEIEHPPAGHPGNDHVKWPHRDHQNWPHSDRFLDLRSGLVIRPLAAPPSASPGWSAGGTTTSPSRGCGPGR